ncbi:triose-phosphate isomerase [Desulfuromonas thiophila]|uniref:Triosephosphate isomerase n=1 Tax=Desulfuromonas thiophila TaxID=57664 RepID=A0A1G7D0E6_9BACT|nr:triose-phosphate isomerase [Desulfuromonas thiophila]SDE45072.1 triosephosphate isomerase [Desulfuromonas thiophila]
MRKPLIAGNWKLHKTLAEAQELARTLKDKLQDEQRCELVIAPPFTALAAVAEICRDSPLQLAGQNCYPATEGAFTGELSPTLLQDAGCHYVILGHSERRQLLGETDTFINAKVQAALAAGLKVILCVGENLAQREDGELFDVIATQMRLGLAEITSAQMAEVVIAYEPVWAIGTGRTASADQAAEVHAFIRGLLQGQFSSEVSESTRILYGGSVKPDNISSLMAEPDIDGALVGGASLDSASFVAIAHYPRPLRLAGQ